MAFGIGCALLRVLPVAAAQPSGLNAPTGEALTASTNPPTVTEDVEATEIKRLLSLARNKDGQVTNQASADAASKLLVQRHQRYREKLKSSKDPVGVAVEIANDHVRKISTPEDIVTAVGILPDHLEDPRSEQALEAVSRSGRHHSGELGTTLEGMAYYKLMEMRSRKELRQIVEGKQTEPERISAIIRFLETRPDLATPYPEPREKAVLAQIIFAELAKSDDTNAVRLVLKSGQFTREFAWKHLPEMLAYAEGITSNEGVLNSPLVATLYDSGEKSVIPLFEKWKSAATTDYSRSYFEQAIRRLRFTSATTIIRPDDALVEKLKAARARMKPLRSPGPGEGGPQSVAAAAMYLSDISDILEMARSPGAGAEYDGILFFSVSASTERQTNFVSGLAIKKGERTIYSWDYESKKDKP